MHRWLGCVSLSVAIASAAVDFNRDIRPILSDRCFTCHGPDQSKRQSKLRLDLEEGAKGARAELVRRITADDPSRMPLGGARLPQREIDLLTRWVAEGAEWQKHWSFLPPKRPAVPDGSNALDYFIRARLVQEGLKPSPEAGRRTLIRRVSLDLTGLPPTPAQVNAFVEDTSANAYEKTVDRLLASPHYGERMAERW